MRWWPTGSGGRKGSSSGDKGKFSPGSGGLTNGAPPPARKQGGGGEGGGTRTWLPKRMRERLLSGVQRDRGRAITWHESEDAGARKVNVRGQGAPGTCQCEAVRTRKEGSRSGRRGG